MNWDTEETERWIDNDERLYLMAEDLTTGAEYRAKFEFLLMGKVNPDKVDWDALAESRNA